MKRTIFALAIFLFMSGAIYGQNVGINGSGAAADASALLDVSATNKGLLIPRVMLTGTNDVVTIASPAISLLVYNSATASNVTPGFYYWNGTLWVRFDLNSKDWSLLGNAGTNPVTNFLGTTDGTAFIMRTSNLERIRIQAGGKVGIWEGNPVDLLHVSHGNIRLGEINPVNTSAFPGYGRRLYFSGGPAGPSYNSGNSDPIWMSRYNLASDASELRLNLSDNCQAADAFVIQTGGSGCAANNVRFRFDGAGTAFKPGGGSWAALSDRRLKHNVQDFSVGLAELMMVRPVSFQYNGQGETSDDGQEYIGVIAQEVAEYAPYMVQETGKFLSVDPSAFTYMLINSVKEQQEQISELKNEKSILKSEMEALREEMQAMHSQVSEIREVLNLQAKK